MEYEKLVYQINPHFLLNVLNSIQWMAQMSHQKDIGEYTSALKKLLSYNLGKEGRETTLRKEIEMVKNYIFLQQKRYDFEVDISVEEGEYLNVPTVRMMLQPLVENAIRYGLGEEGKIAIQTFFDKKRDLVAVTIEDFGHGLSQKEIDEINEPFGYRWNTGKENRGIGIRYVKAMLSTFYQGNADLFDETAKEEQEQRSQLSYPQLKRWTNMNVLIVDDDKLARKGLIAVIDWEQYGLCVVGDVQNGKKAAGVFGKSSGGSGLYRY